MFFFLMGDGLVFFFFSRAVFGQVTGVSVYVMMATMFGRPHICLIASYIKNDDAKFTSCFLRVSNNVKTPTSWGIGESVDSHKK